MQNESKSQSMSAQRLAGMYGRIRIFPTAQSNRFMVVGPNLATIVDAQTFRQLLADAQKVPAQVWSDFGDSLRDNGESGGAETDLGL